MATRPKQRNLGRLSEIAQVAVRHGRAFSRSDMPLVLPYLAAR